MPLLSLSKFLVVLAYMTAILLMSSVPGEIPEDATALRMLEWIPPTLQNLLHVPAYAGLAFIWCSALESKVRRPGLFYLAFLITVAFGLFDEWYQSFIPGRFASITDVLSNSLGAFLGVALFAFILFMKRENKPLE